MKFAYKFKNLLGTVYRQGNLLFTPDGNSVISPVGNRITIFDLKNNKSQTLSVESEYNYTAVDLSPNGCILVAVNEKGHAQMISMVSYTVIHKYKFKSEVKFIKFSPDGKYFAATTDNILMVFKSPGEISGQYNSFAIHRVFEVAYDESTTINWANNSKVIAIGSKDNSVRIQSVEYLPNFRPFILSGHRDEISGCFFEENTLDVNTISKDGQLIVWECSTEMSSVDPILHETQPAEKRVKTESDDEAEEDAESDDDVEKDSGKLTNVEKVVQEDANDKEERDDQGKLLLAKPKHSFFYKRLNRHYLADEARKENRNAFLTSAAYHQKTKILIAAFSTGVFYLYELPDVIMIHSLSISDFKIDASCFNITGDWIALGVSSLGQLLVWEWQSEQYVMKQQGHSNEMSCIAYSPDGQIIVTGGYDGKVKLWNVTNGFCFVTFHEHSSAVRSVDFSGNKKFLVSASLDGTVRAFDIIRYRNFRTFTSPDPVQFVSVAVDQSGELVAAGGEDIFEIYLWSMKLGKLLEILSGHTGPVTSIAFAPVAASSTLVSGSWDKTVKIWECLEKSGAHETIELLSDVVCVAFKPNGEEVAISTLNGSITVFDVKTSQEVASIEGRNDMGHSVADTDMTSSKKNLEGRCFTSICYSADGECILAGGKTKYVCIYNVREGILLKKFQITQNRSLDGLDEYVNRKNLVEFGNLALVEERDPLEGGSVAIKLPGAKKGDLSARNVKPEVNVYSVKFSPTGQTFAASSTEGLLIYSLNKGIVFDPYQLSIEITPKATREFVKKCEFSAALIMALKLNENNLIQEVIEQIPYKEIQLVSQSLPDEFAHRSLKFVSKMVVSSQHIEFYLKWANTILNQIGNKDGVLSQQTLIALHQGMNKKYEMLNKICDFNKYTIQVIKSMAQNRKNSILAENSGHLEDEDELMLIDTQGDVSSEDDDLNDDISEE